jgi:hypothetical protein
MAQHRDRCWLRVLAGGRLDAGVTMSPLAERAARHAANAAGKERRANRNTDPQEA